MNLVVRDYRVDGAGDDERLAAMFNDFDTAWPGGFTRGTPETAERIRERMMRTRRLAILVAEDTESGDLVGYCDLDAQPGQKETAYVGLLGARLSVHGKGVGKALLREAIRRSAEAEYREVTLYTWAGNTKAVPLYKKTGFNWVPDTDVYMRNFIPSALATPIVRAFLGGRDWYALHERDLAVAPDDVTWKGMKVYPYRFRSGDDYVHLVYQADSAGLTAIETPDFSVSCTVPVEEAAAGQTYPIVWNIEPRRGKNIEVVLLTEADAGLEIAVQERLTVSESTQIERNLHVSSTATPRRAGQRTHLVRTILLLDGQPITLETGVKVVRPIEIQYAGQGLLAGREEKITIGLHNRLDAAVTGTMALDAHPSLDCPHPAQPFSLPARSWTQCEFTVTATAPGSHATHLRYQAEITAAPGGEEVRSQDSEVRRTERSDPSSFPKPEPYQGYVGASSAGIESNPKSEIRNPKFASSRSLTFRAFAGGDTLVSIDTEDEEKAVLETLDLRVEVSLRGGNTKVFLNGGTHNIASVGAELGPPFGSTRMRPPLYTARIESDGQIAKLRIIAPSHQSAGLTLERSFSMAAGGVLKIEQRVVNTASHAQPVTLRLRTGSHKNGYLAIPASHGLIREPLQNSGEFPAGETDLLASGAQLTENWAAIEGDGEVCGLIWEGAPVQDMEWSVFPNLMVNLGEIPPHSARTAPTYWLVATTGDWRVVRNWWKRLVQPSGTREAIKVEPVRVLSLAGEPAPILLREAREDATLALTNRRGNGITGSLRLAGSVFLADPAIFALEKVDRDRPLRAEVSLRGPEANAAGYFGATIEAGVLTEKMKLAVVRLTLGDRMEVSRLEPDKVIIDNGYFVLRFATGFFGALTALETGGVNHLLSAWPEAKPFMWMNPWFGGVHAFDNWMGDPAFARETFTSELIERIGERGWRWQGVRMACDLTHKHRLWLRIELEYLTLPGSNALALVLRHTNRTDACMAPYGGVAAWAQPGGTRANATLHWERHGERRTRRRGGFPADGVSGRWAAVENPESGDSLILIATDPAHSAAWEDFGQEGPHIQARGPIDLGPHETQERLFWLVHTSDIAQADAYSAALTEARRLP